MADDELVSQFLMITGSDDTDKAVSYLEMAAGNLEQAVSLFMDHTAAAGGGNGGADGGLMGGSMAGGGMMGGVDDVRAPDATQTMRLMDDVGPGGMVMGGMGMGGMPSYMNLDPMIEERLQNTAFAAPSALQNVRDAINAAAAAADSDEDAKVGMDDGDEEYQDDDDSNAEEKKHIARLADMFAPPHHLMYTEGGFEGARTMAKDSKRWLLVNIQKDSEFASHALNRDVWRDELVENLVREGFILWQSFDIAPEGRVYTERYKVHDYPHIGIIDPRTRRLMWKKEGWTQQNPLTAESFAELAMDFCSRHSFDKPPQAPRPGAAASRPAKRPMHEMSEEEQIQEAMRASLQELTGDDKADAEMSDDEDDEIEYLGNVSGDDDAKPAAKAEEEKPKEPSLLNELLSMDVGDEPAQGARIQLRMPNGKRAVRKFDSSQNVKLLYAYIAQTLDEAKGGKDFVLMAGFPPKDLMEEIDNTIENCKLSGQAITIRWK